MRRSPPPWKREWRKDIYEITDKPDVTRTPIPRFDLLKLDRYASMSIQFSRGCPFQCEFCDIIILYGRKPRTKHPPQVLAELDALLKLGWMKQVFIVDDNFIGNHTRALELCVELEKWQQAHGFPVMFYTEASMDLARKSALLDAMVKANFFYVFLGIESPSKEALKETRKFQNLAMDPVSCVDLIHERGLWVTGGFIVGFDSDTDDIFDRQIEFIERTAIPWAMLNSLHAAPRTALYERMQKEGRLLEDSQFSSGDANPPNFRTKLAPAVLMRGQAKTLAAIYEPNAFFERAWRSLQSWKTRKNQHAARQPGAAGITAIMARSIWQQGIKSSYRIPYWKYVFRIVSHYALNPPKIWMAATIMISGHHFIPYSREVVANIERQIERAGETVGTCPSTGGGVVAFQSPRRSTRLPVALGGEMWIMKTLVSRFYKSLEGNTSYMKNLLKRLWQEEEAQDLVEYGLLLVLIALTAFAALAPMGSGVSAVFSAAASNLTVS